MDIQERFLALQEQYLETRDKKLLGEMYILLFSLEKKLISAWCKKKKFFLSSDDLEDKADEASLFIISRYKEKDFKIKKLGAYASFGRCKALYGRAKTEIRRKKIMDAALKNISDKALILQEQCAEPEVFEGCSFVLTGSVPSKKNSRINTKSGKSFPSERYAEWHKRSAAELFPQRQGIKTIDEPVSLIVKFTHADSRRRDSDNMLSSVLDLLVDCKILLDDDYSIVRRIGIINVKGPKAQCEITIKPED